MKTTATSTSRIFIIVIKSIDNKLLIKSGWKVGMRVQPCDSPYGESVELQEAGFVSGYTLMSTTKLLLDRFSSSVVGVTFEVKEFELVGSR